MTLSESSLGVQQQRTERWRSDKVRVRRQPTRARYDRSTIDAVLDSSRIAHVAFLVVIRRPWSVLVFALFVAALAPLTLALGHPQWGIYLTLGMPLSVLPLATGLWLIRAARQLQIARLELVDQAVVRERLRVDNELRTSIGMGLAELATRADAVKDLSHIDPTAATRELRVLVDGARRTLAEARKVVRRYRESSLRTELETIAILLNAAGIETRFELPPGHLPGPLDESGRRVLLGVVGDVLSSRASAATITVTTGDGLVRVALRSGSDTWTAEAVAA